MRPIAAAAVTASILTMALPGISLANASSHNVRVNSMSDGIFEAVLRTGNGHLFWCGAADYAHRVIGAPWHAKLHITRGLGPSETTGRRSAVQFTLDAKLAQTPPPGGYGSVNSLQAGDTMSVQRALDYCFVPLGRP
ncbi:MULTISPECIES: hypothetical protein [unclassified Leisingera]|uniref:hypothetical protein n=1 Tax=unclassified Leisingera TaxID=2614906 RepID=UPI001269ED83|nr:MULTISPECIES: hypothetical protein [unclassified Leisingera]